MLQRQLYNVWLRTSELRTSVAMQRIKLQQARQAHKLRSILCTHVSSAVVACEAELIVGVVDVQTWLYWHTLELGLHEVSASM